MLWIPMAFWHPERVVFGRRGIGVEDGRWALVTKPRRVMVLRLVLVPGYDLRWRPLRPTLGYRKLFEPLSETLDYIRSCTDPPHVYLLFAKANGRNALRCLELCGLEPLLEGEISIISLSTSTAGFSRG